MTGYQQTDKYNMPLTLEEHFEMLARTYPAVQEFRSENRELLKTQFREKGCDK